MERTPLRPLRCLVCGAACASGCGPCDACGVSLAAPCPACGTRNLAHQGYCGECGAALRREAATPAPAPARRASGPAPPSAAAAPEDERKIVTVLFADIAGSLALLAGRDPEDANRILDNALHRMMDAVHLHQGTVSQARGDGIMAIFGAPVAHEDHAVRACFAALKIQASLAAYSAQAQRTEGIPVHVRVGMNSGEVVVRSMRNDIYLEYTAVGEVTHMAARMEHAARPGSILISAETARLVEGQIHLRSIGAVDVKGMAHKVEAFEVLGPGARQAMRPAPGGRGLSAFVGRGDETATLEQALARAAGGHGQVVSVVGEAGLGKSRLLREFVRTHLPAGWAAQECCPTRFGHATSLLPVVELLRRHFDIQPGDAPERTRTKARALVQARYPALNASLAPLLDMLDALPPDDAFRQLDAARRRDATVAALVALLLAEAGRQPLVVIFEDLHWTDSLTLAWLDEVVRAIAAAPVLLLVSHRPEFALRWSATPHHHALHLAALPAEGARSLLDALLGAASELAPMKQFLCSRSGGNPFFVEEMVRSFVETGIVAGSAGAYRQVAAFESAHVPATIEALLAARVDRLPGPEKHLLQEMAVIGSTAPLELVQELVQRPASELHRMTAFLQSAGFLIEARLSADPAHAFGHALTHEVVYNELLRERRREVHARVVAAIERVHAARLEDFVDQLAEHALRGQLWTQALDYLRRAGQRAAHRHAYREAVTFLEKALGLVEHLPGSRETLEQAVDIHFAVRNALQPLGERKKIAEVLQAAAALAERLGDARRIGWVQAYLTDHFWISGQGAQACQAGERALAVARASGDVALQVATRLPLGLVHHTRGDFRQAMEHFEWNIATLQGPLAEESFGFFVLPSVFSRSFQAWALAEVGEFAQALPMGQAAAAMAEAARHPMSAGYAQLCLGVVHLRRGHCRDAVAAFEHALSIASFAGSPVGAAYVAFHHAYAKVLEGRESDGLERLERTVQEAERRGFVARHALRLAYLCEVYAMAGRLDEALVAAARGVKMARAHEERANEAYVLRACGEALRRHGRLREARSRLQAALALARRLGLRPLAANCESSLALVHAASGRASLAARHDETATMQARRMGLRLWVDAAQHDRRTPQGVAAAAVRPAAPATEPRAVS